MQEINGQLVVKGKKFAIVSARFNSLITERLIEGALDSLKRHGTLESDITVVRVPGCFEITAATAKLKKSGKFDGIVAVGALIRGATPHFDYIAKAVTNGLASLAGDGEVAISFGILTTDSIEQAIERAGTKSGNKGFDAANTVIEMVSLFDEMKF